MQNMILFADIRSNIDQKISDAARNLMSFAQEQGPVLLQRLAVAVAIFFVGQWLAKTVQRFLERALDQAKVDKTLSSFLCRLTFVGLMCATGITAIQTLGVETTSFAAILAAAGFAIAMALKDSLGNFASGVMIILFRPFSVGDVIEAAGTKGVVEEIHIFNTIMNSPDNVKTYVPNGAITTGNITNYSRERMRRVDLTIGCGYSDDLRAVKRFLESLLENHPLVVSEPKPVVAVNELGDNSVNFVVRPWVLNADYWKVRWDLTEQIKLGFDECGFEFPFPQRSVHVTQTGSGHSQQPALQVGQPGVQQPLTERPAMAQNPTPVAPQTVPRSAATKPAATKPAAASQNESGHPATVHSSGPIQPRRVA